MSFFKKISFVSAALFLLACTDYVADIDEQIEELEATIKNSSSSGTVKSSSSAKTPSSSAVTKSSSSEKIELSSSSVTPKSSNSETSVSSGIMTDTRDGQTYKTVTIGSQTWMAENLNYKATASYCYNDEAANCAKYGRLYRWAAAMDSTGTWTTNGKGCGYNKTCLPTYPVRGVCPEGWHLPTQTEWNTLFTSVGGSSTAGTMLKSISGWDSSGNGTDAFGFSALPAGSRFSDGNYDDEGNYAYFWCSTEYDSGSACVMYLDYGLDNASLYGSRKIRGFSVRCLQDDALEQTAESSSSVKSSSSSEDEKLSSSEKVESSSSSEAATSSSSAIKSSSSISSSSEETGSSITPDRVGPVSQYGQLMTGKNSLGQGRIYGGCEGVKDGAEVQVRGMSLYWSLMPQAMEFWTEEGVTTMVNDMKIQVVRAAMATGDEDWLGTWNGIQLKGYGRDPTNQTQFVKTVVEAAIKNDIYVIIDWHSHNANEQTESAKDFFKEMAETYGQYDNVIFEVFNEPRSGITWNEIKNYANQVIEVIRQYSDNLILVGTPDWDQQPQWAIGNEVNDSKNNTAYTLHYFANTNCVSGDYCIGVNAEQAINAGLSVFISEWGSVDATNNGIPNYSSNDSWQEFVNGHKLSWANWSASYVSETASAFPEGSTKTSLLYTESGNLVKGYLASNPATYTACSANP